MGSTQTDGAAGGGRAPERRAHAGRGAKKKKQRECWTCGGIGHGWRACPRDGAAAYDPRATVKQGDREDFPLPREETKCGEIGHERRVCQRAGAAAYEPRAAPTQRGRDGYPATREEARELQEALDFLDERQRQREEERRHGVETRPPGTNAADKAKTGAKNIIDAFSTRLRYNLHQRYICAACFGEHEVARCPVPGRGIRNAASWPGTGCFGCGGAHDPHKCSRVARAVHDQSWRKIFGREWCFGCGERHALRACTRHSPTEKDLVWSEAISQFQLKKYSSNWIWNCGM
jgi:hypothetical protein